MLEVPAHDDVDAGHRCHCNMEHVGAETGTQNLPTFVGNEEIKGFFAHLQGITYCRELCPLLVISHFRATLQKYYMPDLKRKQPSKLIDELRQLLRSHYNE